MNLGCPRLYLTSGTYAAQRLGNGHVMLSVWVDVENGNDDVWVDRYESPPDVAAYRLYLRPAPPGHTAPGGPVELAEHIAETDIATVWLTDADGRHEIPIEDP